MTALCITGYDQPLLESAWSTLRAHGLQPDQPLVRDSEMTLQRWHCEVGARLKGTVAGRQRGAVGRLWEQLAADLLMSNMGDGPWGWADAGSSALLGFWADFESEVSFLIVCETPAEALQRAWASAGPQGRADTEAEVLVRWHEAHAKLMRFHHDHRDRSLLVWNADVVAHPQGLARQVTERLGVSGLGLEQAAAGRTAPAAPQVAWSPAANPMGALLAGHLLQGFPEALALARELQSVVQPLGGDASGHAVETGPFSTWPADVLVASYRQLIDRSAEHAAVRTLEAQTREAAREAGLLQAEIRQTQDALAQLQQVHAEGVRAREDLVTRLAAEASARSELQAQLTARAAAEEEARARAAAELQKTHQEGELLLAQLHQLQVEQERHHVDNQRLRSEAAAERDSHARLLSDLQAKLAAEAQAKAELQAHRDADARALTDLRATLAAETQAKAELLVLRDTDAKALADVRVKLAAETQAKSELLMLRDIDAQALTDLHAKLAAETRARTELLVLRDGDAQALSDLQAKLDAETQARVELLALRDGDAQALTDLQAKLAAETQAKVELQTRRNADARVLADLQAKHTTQAQVHADLQAQLAARAQAESAASAQAAAEVQTQRQENALLLSQLHDVQEELERYYLDNQRLRDEATTERNRPARALQSSELAFEIEAVGCDAGLSDARDVAWNLAGLRLHQRSLPVLKLRTRVEQGVAAFVIQRADPGSHAPLLRWPVTEREADELLLSPVAGADDGGKHRAAVIAQLASSDWALLRTLPRLLGQALQDGRVALPGAHDPRTLHQALGRTEQMLAWLPHLLRFDDVELFGQQFDTTRSVIGLRLRQLSVQGRRIQQLEFQLQATPSGDGLDGPVYLIFGEAAVGFPLETWLPNAKGASGQPMSGIALGPDGPSTAVWNALSAHDRQFITALVDSLPLTIVLLQAGGARCKQGWPMWKQLADHLRTWVRLGAAGAAGDTDVATAAADAGLAVRRTVPGRPSAVPKTAGTRAGRPLVSPAAAVAASTPAVVPPGGDGTPTASAKPRRSAVTREATVSAIASPPAAAPERQGAKGASGRPGTTQAAPASGKPATAKAVRKSPGRRA